MIWIRHFFLFFIFYNGKKFIQTKREQKPKLPHEVEANTKNTKKHTRKQQNHNKYKKIWQLFLKLEFKIFVLDLKLSSSY